MFDDVADPNCDLLDKPPDAYWIVGPIVSRHGDTDQEAEVIGFISVDTCEFDHDSVNEEPRLVDVLYPREERLFCRLAMDLASDLLSLILPYCMGSIPEARQLRVQARPAARSDEPSA